MNKLMLAVTVFSCVNSLWAIDVPNAAKPGVSDPKNKSVVKQQVKVEVSPQKRIRNEINTTGVLLYLTQDKLYHTDGSRNYQNNIKVGNICPGTAKYMLYENRLYRVKDNVITVKSKLEELDSLISQDTKKVSEFRKEVEQLKIEIDRALGGISSTYMSSSPSKNSFTDTSGAVNSVESYELSREAKKFIKDLERKNRERERAIRKIENKTTTVLDNLESMTALFDKLTAKNLAFSQRQDEFLAKLNKPSISAAEKRINTLESRLIRLKSLFLKKLISKEVYDEKAGVILDEFL